ncbi:hypothetical protein NXV81_14325 [Bacteroides ovatus]|nr:hypothetical protein [Bacteroides ovatus]
MMSDIHPFSEAKYKGYNIAQYIVDDHWSESNNVAGAAYPRLSPEFITNNAQTSTYYLRNAAFLRLKNAELGYSFFPWLRVYAAGTNLLTFSPFSTWDPEMGSGNGLKYPLQRTVQDRDSVSLLIKNRISYEKYIYKVMPVGNRLFNDGIM